MAKKYQKARDRNPKRVKSRIPIRQQLRDKNKEIQYWKQEYMDMDSTIKAKNLMLKDWAAWIKELTGMDDEAMNEAVNKRLAKELGEEVSKDEEE